MNRNPDAEYKALRCTWDGCEGRPLHPQLSASGEPWAHLCDAHDGEWRLALSLPSIGDTGIKRILALWVKAQGGARAAADRM